jgi:phosphoglycolate phosphatase
VPNSRIRRIRTLRQSGIADLIELVVGDQPGMPRKPDPALFTQVVRRAFPTVGHDRVLIVGDTDADIRFAHNARIRSCWARYGYGNTDACMALAPDFVVSAPGELASIVL